MFKFFVNILDAAMSVLQILWVGVLLTGTVYYYMCAGCWGLGRVQCSLNSHFHLLDVANFLFWDRGIFATGTWYLYCWWDLMFSCGVISTLLSNLDYVLVICLWMRIMRRAELQIENKKEYPQWNFCCWDLISKGVATILATIQISRVLLSQYESVELLFPQCKICISLLLLFSFIVIF